MNQLLPSTDDVVYEKFKVIKVYFNYGYSFYIDNLAFARSTIQGEHNMMRVWYLRIIDNCYFCSRLQSNRCMPIYRHIN